MQSSRSHLKIALMGFLALALAMGVGRFAFTPLLAMMKADGLLGVAEGGWIAGVHFLGYLMGALSAAALPLSPRAVMRRSLAVVALGTVLMGFTENLVLWCALRWACGVVSAWTLVTVSSHYVRYLSARGGDSFQGLVFAGVGGGIALVGLACIALMANEIGSAAAWQWIGAAALVVGLVICLRFGPELPAQRTTDRRQATKRSPLVWPLILAYGAAGLGYIVPATYLPVMARELVTDPLVFGWSWPVFGIAAAFSTLLAAALQHRFGNRAIWAVSQAVLGLGVAVPVLADTMTAIVMSGALVGGTFMIITMLGMKEAHRIAPEADVTRHIAAMTTAFATGQMIGPVLGSVLYDLSGDFAAVLIITGLAVAATTAFLRPAPNKSEVKEI